MIPIWGRVIWKVHYRPLLLLSDGNNTEMTSCSPETNRMLLIQCCGFSWCSAEWQLQLSDWLFTVIQFICNSHSRLWGRGMSSLLLTVRFLVRGLVQCSIDLAHILCAYALGADQVFPMNSRPSHHTYDGWQRSPGQFTSPQTWSKVLYVKQYILLIYMYLYIYIYRFPNEYFYGSIKSAPIPFWCDKCDKTRHTIFCKMKRSVTCFKIYFLNIICNNWWNYI